MCTNNFEFENEYVKNFIQKNIGIIKIKKNIFGLVSNLRESMIQLSIFEKAKLDPDFKVLLVLSEPSCLSESAYKSCIEELSTSDKILFNEKVNNILNRFVEKMIKFNKVIIFGLNTSVFTTFIGITLAADFRLASENMSFSVTFLNFGTRFNKTTSLILPHYINQGKISEILYKGEDVDANYALELGLINKILPEENFEKACISEAVSWTKKYLDPLSITSLPKRFLLRGLKNNIF